MLIGKKKAPAGKAGAKGATDKQRALHTKGKFSKAEAQGTPEQQCVADNEGAVAFLGHHFAGMSGVAWVCAIHPETGEIKTQSAPTDETHKLRPFIEQHNGTWNLYFGVNPAKRSVARKPPKADILHAAYLHVDIDPIDGRPLAAEKQRIVKQVEAYPSQPTTIVDTGGGVAAYWQLRKPMDANEAETLNRQLAKDLGGDHCHNIDRMMRLPGTINLPDEKKRAKGRIKCPARVLRRDGPTYNKGDFRSLLAAANQNEAPEIGDLGSAAVPQRFYDDALALDPKLRDRWEGSTDGLNDTSRSGLDMSLAALLVPWGFTDSEIAAILREFPHGKATDKGDDYIRAMLRKARQGHDSGAGEALAVGGWISPTPIGAEEWRTARTAPDCIVQNYFYADVGVFVAPGGSSKTTLMLFQAVQVVLGLPLFGHEIQKPGPVVLVTHEDSREILVARLRHIAQDMELDDADTDKVMRGVLIADVSGSAFRLTAVRSDVVVPNIGVDEVIASCRELNPVLVVIDPAVSFGVGESRVNDAEQGLIEAGRKLRRALNCCVMYIHHSGKQNARDKVLDQYAGRGGSAFADGARMVHVLQNLSPEEWQQQTGDVLCDGETGMVLARPKMSYCPPVGELYIKRVGYSFSLATRIVQDPKKEIRQDAEAVWQYLQTEYVVGSYHSGYDLEKGKIPCGLSRKELRDAVQFLRSRNLVEVRPLPPEAKRKDGHGQHKYLHPLERAAAPNFGGGAEAKTDIYDDLY